MTKLKDEKIDVASGAVDSDGGATRVVDGVLGVSADNVDVASARPHGGQRLARIATVRAGSRRGYTLEIDLALRAVASLKAASTPGQGT